MNYQQHVHDKLCRWTSCQHPVGLFVSGGGARNKTLMGLVLICVRISN